MTVFFLPFHITVGCYSCSCFVGFVAGFYAALPAFREGDRFTVIRKSLSGQQQARDRHSETTEQAKARVNANSAWRPIYFAIPPRHRAVTRAFQGMREIDGGGCAFLCRFFFLFFFHRFKKSDVCCLIKVRGTRLFFFFLLL